MTSSGGSGSTTPQELPESTANGSGAVVHNVSCHSCEASQIIGKRYKILSTYWRYSLCEKCFENGSGDECGYVEHPGGKTVYRWNCDSCSSYPIMGNMYQGIDNKNVRLCESCVKSCCVESYKVEETTGFMENPSERKIEVHSGHKCSSCHRSPILRNRYQAMNNEDVDLCESCFPANLKRDELGFVEHPGGTTIYCHTCDSCSSSPIVGRRYQGLIDRNYTLCESCFGIYNGQETHFEEHPSGKTIAIEFRELDSGVMGEPIRAKYRRRNKSYTEETALLGKTQDKSEPVPVAERGITLRQLRAVKALVKRMCKEGTMVSTAPGKPKTPLSEEEVTLYDINHHIIMRYTEETKKSFVESLPSTAGTQPPRWFVSHWWGEQFSRTMACIETLFEDFGPVAGEERGGGMTLDTPIWICAFANNQHNLADITDDPAKSGFAQALEVANHRAMSILDEAGVVFTRIWCIEELYLTHTLSQSDPNASEKGVWAVYTYKPHILDRANFEEDLNREAVGIVEGGTTGDMYFASERESHFPNELLLKSLDIQVQRAQASVESDRRHILNSIARIGLNETPYEEHENYAWLNNVVRGSFATKTGAIRAAYQQEGRDEWLKILPAIEKSSTMKKFTLNFKAGYGGFDMAGIQMEEAIELIQHLPNSIEEFEIKFNPFGALVIDAAAEFLESSRGENVRNFMVFESSNLDAMANAPECGIRLAAAISKSKNIKSLGLYSSGLVGSLNGSAWEKAFKQNSSLTNISIRNFTEYATTTNTEEESSRKWTPLELKAALQAATTVDIGFHCWE